MPKESTCHLAGWLFLFTGVLGTIGLCLALYKMGALYKIGSRTEHAVSILNMI